MYNANQRFENIEEISREFEATKFGNGVSAVRFTGTL